MSQRSLKEFGVVPGSHLDTILRIMNRRERRSMLAVMAERMPPARTTLTRRQRKWRARLQQRIQRRGVVIA